MYSLKLRKIEDEDINLVDIWMHKDFIIKWYTNPDEWINEMRQRFTKYLYIKHFIVTDYDRPIGFCQYYNCLAAEEDWYGDIPLDGTYSIDYLIGEEDYLKKGMGKQIINLLVEKVFSLPDSKRIIVSPDSENTSSRKTLESNDFVFDKKNDLFIRNKSSK